MAISLPWDTCYVWAHTSLVTSIHSQQARKGNQKALGHRLSCSGGISHLHPLTCRAWTRLGLFPQGIRQSFRDRRGLTVGETPEMCSSLFPWDVAQYLAQRKRSEHVHRTEWRHTASQPPALPFPAQVASVTMYLGLDPGPGARRPGWRAPAVSHPDSRARQTTLVLWAACPSGTWKVPSRLCPSLLFRDCVKAKGDKR